MGLLPIFEYDLDELIIVPIGDIHYGHGQCMYGKFESYFQYALDTPNACIVGMGDFLELSNRDTPGASIYEQVIPPQKQLEDMTVMLDKYKSKILGMVVGNHEFRTMKSVGIDAHTILCEKLGIADWHYGQLVRFNVRGQIYHVYFTHGDGGGTSRVGKSMKCAKLRDAVDADVYCMGHVHHKDIAFAHRLAPDPNGAGTIMKKSVFGLTGHFLEWEGSYAQQKGYAPGSPGVIKIKFYGDRWDIHSGG